MSFPNFATVLIQYVFLCDLKNIQRRINRGTYVTEGAGGGTRSNQGGGSVAGRGFPPLRPAHSPPPLSGPAQSPATRKARSPEQPAQLELLPHAPAHTQAARRGPGRVKPAPRALAAAQRVTPPEGPPTAHGAGWKRSPGRGAERQALGGCTWWAEAGRRPGRAGDMQRDSGQAAGQWLDLRPLPSVARAPLLGSLGGLPRDGVGASRCSPAPRRGCGCPGRCPGPGT